VIKSFFFLLDILLLDSPVSLRTQLVLIPYYARMAAILDQSIHDVAPQLIAMLEEEFNYLTHKKDQINIETKVRNIRFIGELVKFRKATTGFVFSCLKTLLDDFMHHNIEVACHLLETAGRFLYRSPETHVRTKNMLEIMMRLKNAKNLDSRLDTMVENAYYYCKPPEKLAVREKPLTLMQQYINKLIFQDLSKVSKRKTTSPAIPFHLNRCFVFRVQPSWF
jgi:regulator of nonsense transcripts 2